MEILAEILGFIFFDLIFSGLGWLYLIIRYRNKEKRLKVLNEKYEGAYSNIIRLFFVNTLYYGIGIPLIAMWLVAVIGFFGWLIMLGVTFVSNHF